GAIELRRFNPRVRRHPRKKLAVIVVRVNDHRIGDDIVELEGSKAHLRHLPLKPPPRISVDGKLNTMAFENGSDIRLIDLSLDADAPQILRNLEKLRCLQASRHDLPDINGPADDGAVDGRLDTGAVEVDLRLEELRLALGDGGFGILELRLGDLDFGLGHVSIACRRIKRHGGGNALAGESLLPLQQASGIALDGL